MKKLTKFFNLIKENKQTRILSIMTIAMLFIFTIGYSLSMFTGGSNKKVANIKVNDLSFNMTTNSGTSDDRVLHLQAGKLEQFDIILTNLNKVNIKYEIIYELCNNQDCTSTSKDIPKDLLIYKEKEDTNINGSLDINKSNSIRILTKNKSSSDYYIKLSLNAGYSWNDLDLIGQIKDVISINQDIDIIAYVDGKEVSDLPTTCFYTSTSKAYKNNAELADTTVTFNCNYVSNSWSYAVDNIKNLPDKIIVNFEHTGINAVEYLTTLQQKDTNNINGLFIDDTSDKNLRYTGAIPNNYVEFGNTGELWRIVGIFNVKDSEGNIVRNIKLVRDSALGGYSWDARLNTQTNDYRGINDWNTATLMKELNGDYLNYNLSSNINWYNNYWQDNKAYERQTGVFDYTKTIKQKYQDMINNSVWNTGANGYTGTEPYPLNLLTQYAAERGNKLYSGDTNNKVTRTSTWTGKVGLIYASDYGYASTLADCHNDLRVGITYDKSTDTWNYSNGLCKTYNWLAKTSWYWTLSPYSGNSNHVFLVGGDGAVLDSRTSNASNVFPAVFLKSDVKITSGTGEKDNPYKLSL